jgi:ornithine cyclodeaminase
MKFVDAAQVSAGLDVHRLVDALRAGFQSDWEMPLRHRHTVKRADEPDSYLALMPAWRSDGALGVKVTTIVPGNAARNLSSVMPIYILFDSLTGAPSAVMDGRMITLHRTAATSALAATYLAREDSRRLLMVGTGALAPHLVRAHCAVRRIDEVLVWGRRPAKAEELVAGLGPMKPRVIAVTDLEAAARSADIISCATLSDAPLVFGKWLKPGTHVDLVGSFTPTMREVDDEAVRTARVYADKREAALVEPGDITQPIANGAITPDHIVGDLFGLARDTVKGRRDANEITIFKSVGLALEDLVAARLVLGQGA